ncbi:hypothetical protein [Ramlibacter sp.]|uniref:hypothetical protein n=1 Tax=Ramlibacter sp. TaxID=1917967 RepID=UPI002D25DBF8|nr:hypothetical protein [Ramlibacter sp.]HYD75849.1 hypothetical protein [Ramlibacter sp.]
MYAPPADRTSPWLVQLARLQAERSGTPQTPFALELAAVRNEVAHFAAARPAAPRAAGGLVRRSRLQSLG